MEDEVTLTPSQDAALKKCVAWFKNPTKKQVFKIYGAAGTGKSFLVGRIVAALSLQDDEVAFCAPTGKAATVLMKRFRYSNISTLCHLIYIPYSNDRLIVTDDDEIEGIESSTEFKSKPKVDFKLIVLDEASMVDEMTMRDLMSYDIPIIAVGDPFQLPPINSKPIDKNGADVLLTEIMRQAADNPIVKLATDIRNGKKPKVGVYGDKVVVAPYVSFTEAQRLSMMSKVDQVICGLNSTRRRINKKMRAEAGFKSTLPAKGDKLICKSNEQGIMLTANINLCNGMIGRCTKDAKVVGKHLVKVGFKADSFGVGYNLLADSGTFDGFEFTYDPHWVAYKMRDGTYEPKRKILDEMKLYDKKMYDDLTSEENDNKSKSLGRSLITRFDYGYCISCHAAQGSEFDSVLVIDESDTFRQNASRWLYTAVTRAKDKLILLI